MSRRAVFALAAVSLFSASLTAPVMAGPGKEAAKEAVKAAPLPEGVKEIATNQLKAALANKTATVIDSRAKEAFDKAHVDGALSMPLANFDVSKLPADKAAQLVFYCGGPACTLAPQAAAKARAAGYSNVFVYHEGISGWTEAQKANKG